MLQNDIILCYISLVDICQRLFRNEADVRHSPHRGTDGQQDLPARDASKRAICTVLWLIVSTISTSITSE